ncbi:MAG: SDR family oxidoreductase, partial [Candidatus Bathyarchaeia archaeon]
MSSFKDKVVVVTGGASGIGEATAKIFAAKGAKVVIADVDEEKGKRVVDEIRRSLGEAMFIRVDVSKAEDVKNLIEETVKRFRRIDIMINNAGIPQKVCLVHEIPIEIFESIINVNLKGVFYGIKYAIPVMLNQGGGVIINVASALGIKGSPGLGAYSASKSGVIQLTRVAASEYAKSGIRIVAVAPGPTKTPLL